MGGYEMKNYVKEPSFSDALKQIGYREGKKEIIEKACKWLEQHKEDYNKYDAWRGEYVDFNELITDFKKAIEGKHG
jgi:TolA-binding protein